MSLNRFWLTRMSRVERQVIEAVRDLHHAAKEVTPRHDAIRHALRGLVAAADRCGYAIGKPGAEHVGEDELRLIAWLSILQRERTEMTVALDHRLAEPLRQAALALKPSHPLPIQSVLRADIVMGRPTPSTRFPSPIAERWQSAAALDERALPAWMRAVAYTRKRGRASAKELVEIGLSHQSLAALHGKGVLIRVRHGFYEAPPAKEPAFLSKS